MPDLIEDILTFIGSAERARKYPAGTAHSYRVAVKAFGSNMNDEEKSSIAIFKDHLNLIYRDIFNKNKAIAPSTLDAYKSRVSSVIDDFSKYGNDPSKWSSWSRPVASPRVRRPQKTDDTSKALDVSKAEADPRDIFGETARIEIPLGFNQKAVLIVPLGISSKGLGRIEGYVKALKNLDDTESNNTESSGEVA